VGVSAPKLAVSLVSGAGADVLRVSGEVDLATGEEFAAHLGDALGTGRPLIVDLRELSYIDVRGVKALEDAGVRATGDGRRFVIVSSNKLFQKLFSILRFDGGAEMVSTVNDALRLVGQAERA
jgi:anti-sigma B factor antagonist